VTPLRRLCKSLDVVLAPRRSHLKRFLSFLSSPLPDMALRLPSVDFKAKLDATLKREGFDVIQVEGIEMARYLLQIKRTGYQSLIVFDDHNAEYVLQKRAFETDIRNPTRWIGALYSFVQWRKLRRYEAMICKLADRVIAVSEADREALRRLVPGLEVTVVPNGVDTEYYTMTKSQLGNCPLVFTGKMDFRPNVDAVIWFCREVLPLVQRDFPSVRLFIVGQSPSRRVISLARNPAVTVTGYVEDVRPYISGALVYVLPLRMGGGTRLKLLEAMAMGKAIVSTSLGCEGFDVTHGRELVVADDAEEFAHLVVELLRDAQRGERLGKEARRFAERYDWRNIVPKMERVYG
jgi:glycosyltransferase involved in cell wall biosynthesis